MSKTQKSLEQQINELEKQVDKEKKISRALLKRVKTDLKFNSSAEDLFHHNARLQEKIKDTNQQLQSEKDVFETLYNKSSDAVILFKTDTTFDCNEAAKNLFQLSTQTGVTYKELLDLSPPTQSDGEKSEKKFYEMIATAVNKGFHRFQWQNKKVNGELFWTDIVLTKVKLNKVPVMHGIIRDISKQKKLEEDIIIEKELALKANQLKSTFLANMSHELRTPMHSVLSFAKIGLKKISDADRNSLERYFTNINTSGERLLHLLNDLLDLSKLESGKMVLNKVRSDLKSVFETCYLEQENHFNSKNIKLQLKDDSSDLEGFFDVFRINQVVTNLLSNALKFSPEKSVIQVSLAKNNKNLLFSIQDQGVGIPEKECTLIFDHFVQSSKTKTNEGGTGLGLAISKEIIDQHQGRIWVENSKSGGSIFTFEIPTKANF